jgi:hypothetical protein
MSDIRVGDKVYIIVFEDEDLIGEVISEGDIPWSEEEDLLSEEHEEIIYWWKVKIYGTGETKDFPEDRLRRMSMPKPGDIIRVIDGENKGKTGEIIGPIPIEEVRCWAIEFENEGQTVLEDTEFEIMLPE